MIDFSFEKRKNFPFNPINTCDVRTDYFKENPGEETYPDL
jgi:hypothetical protein